MSKEPEWLTELLEQADQREEKHRIEMSKIRADQALAVIASFEEKASEIEQIAQQEIDLITSWKEFELSKLQRKISWLSFQIEQYMRTTGESTLNLAHGTIKIRKSRDKVDVIDPQKFLPIGKKLGLVRHIDAQDEPDLNAIRAYLKTHGNRPPIGVTVTPGQPTFSYKTIKKGIPDEQIEDGRIVEPEQTSQAAA
ncbi:MAG: host-nuclease inhibitor Gam family protein [Bacteroidetes bacterium]|nr:host-nuclease inhibitor Gam family protein [Bacteroidota bacterium]